MNDRHTLEMSLFTRCVCVCVCVLNFDFLCVSNCQLYMYKNHTSHFVAHSGCPLQVVCNLCCPPHSWKTGMQGYIYLFSCSINTVVACQIPG